METNQLLINYYKKEEMKKVKTRYEEGLTVDEIIRLANNEYITEEEIKEILGIDEEDIIENNQNENIENVIDEQDVIIEDFEEEQANEENNAQVVMIEETKLEDYPDQPFKLYDEDKKTEMMESIRINGIMQPLIVRKIENDKYQILAGHNRRNCGREIGLKEFPCIIKENLTDDEARIYLIDTNLCTRESISPIERAKAYRIKYDTYKKRNIKTTLIEEIKKDNVGLREKIIKEEKSSNGNIQRYLRLTYLIPKLQNMIDQGKMSINIGEKVSFLPNKEQQILEELLSNEKIKLSETIIKRIRAAAESCKLDNPYSYVSKEEMLDLIKNKSKMDINIIEKMIITFSKEEVLRYFNRFKTQEEVKEYIIEILENK